MSYEALFQMSNYNIIQRFDLSLDRIMTFLAFWLIFVLMNRKEASFITKIEVTFGSPVIYLISKPTQVFRKLSDLMLNV